MKKPLLKRFKVYFLGLRGSKVPGSDTRRMTSRIVLFLSIIILIAGFVFDPFHAKEFELLKVLGALIVCIASAIIFFHIVLLMPFRDNGDNFVLDAPRLLTDTLKTGISTIVAFALFFQLAGLSGREGIFFPDFGDALYFSIVTFTTLGYGDFSPSEFARLPAACQAMLGNLHLGMVVGASFAALRK